ncbi:unnamed protein product [Thlaspi arvense]|uniref:Remorin C-terminal domain-containing protein n=1 Tax=Thlaspi arvense TaxID=13288 RepID=A0AAU9SJR2_THLAR|nr:unnamed protein product [Thlaspi arvense]
MATNRNRQTNLIRFLTVFFLLTTATAGGKWSNQTRRANPRVQHAYYSYPHRSCESFSRPYARSMCIELERIHRSSRQPLFSPPPPPPEIDQRYGVDKRLGAIGKNLCLMGPAVDLWKETQIGKTRKKYEKLSEKILSWEDKKKKKAKRKLHRTERGVEKTKMKAMQRFSNENESIGMIVASARAHAYESRMKEEMKVKEKANLMRTAGQNPSACLC